MAETFVRYQDSLTIPLSVPANLAAALGGTGVDLSWDAVTNADSYTVQRETRFESELPETDLVGRYEARLQTGYSNNDVLTTVTNGQGTFPDLDTAKGTPRFIENVLNGHPVFRGDGGASRVFSSEDLGSAGSISITTVVRSAGGGTGRKWPFVTNGPTTTGTSSIFAFTENVNGNEWGTFVRTSATTVQYQDTADATAEFKVLTLTWDGVDARFYVNGTLQNTSPIGGTLSLFDVSLLGYNGGGSLDLEGIEGDVALSAVWLTELDAAARAKVHTYVQDTYGIQVSDYQWGEATEFTGIATNSYTDTTIVNGTTYRYRVKAVGTGVYEDSDFSAWVEIDTLQVESGTGLLSGKGALASTGSASRVGTGSVSGKGALTATGSRATSGTSSVSGAGALSSAGRKATGGLSGISGNGALTASHSAGRLGTSAISGAGSIATTGLRNSSSAASISGAGALTSTGAATRSGTALISGAGQLVAVGDVILGVPQNLTGELVNGNVDLTWNAADNAEFYRLLRQRDELGAWVDDVEFTGIITTSYSDTTVVNGEQYQYFVASGRYV